MSSFASGPDGTHLSAGGPVAADYAQGRPTSTSPLPQSANHGFGGRFNEDFDSSRPHSRADANRPESTYIDGDPGSSSMRRSNSVMSQSQTLTPSRGGTLKKKNSLKKGNSLRRSSSRRSLAAGSVKSLALGDREKYEGSDLYSAFFTPVPTKGNPTEILANRFQDWRKVLKDLISYFREVQKSHEARSKSLLSLSNIVTNISSPPSFLNESGIGDATQILASYHKQALSESTKAKNIEEDIIVQLTGLRSDLSQKIKEIKNLSADFKNSVDKETDSTRKAVRNLQEALGLVDTDSSATSGKGDPYIVKLAVERQIDKQIDEENYLHKAFLNLENSGRELESIVIGEIQKAYNAYAGVLKRDADEAYDAVEKLRTGPVSMAKDHEWDAFVMYNENFVDPRMPLRNSEQITYPGKDAPAAAEVRSGMLERKSKYLKSYTPGWYVLSPTHLHEFKSADRLNLQTPIMSLYLQEQKLGSHSQPDSSSHKFMLKGRQTGGMHRGHGWVFRAESRDTMLAWYSDVKSLTEKTGLERDAFVRRHARSMSAGSLGARSVSSDGGMEEDEADHTPFSPVASQAEQPIYNQVPERPMPGGRFPSDVNVQRNLQVPLSPSSGSSSGDRDALAAAGSLPGSGVPFGESGHVVTNEEYPPYRDVHDGSVDFAAVKESAAPQEQIPSEAQPLPIPATRYENSVPATTPKFYGSPLPELQQEPITTTEKRTLPVQSESQPTHPIDTSSQPPAPISMQPTSPVSPNLVHEANSIPVELGTSNTLSIPVRTKGVEHANQSIEQAPASEVASVITTMTDSTTGEPFGRPALTTQDSIQTISDLHIPGQYPKSTRSMG